jgi:hypothetical protein
MPFSMMLAIFNLVVSYIKANTASDKAFRWIKIRLPENITPRI